MNTPMNPLTLLVAAHDTGQSAALAEMLQAVRPGIRVLHLESALDAESPTVAMVVEPVDERFGVLSAEVRQRFPNLALVMIAARFDEAAIHKAASVGASAIIPSPCESSALLRVLKGYEREVPFPGRLSGVETGDLLRLHAAACSNGVLHLEGEGRHGAIHLEDGQPVHAHAGELRGGDAVVAMLGWAAASATWISGRSASARTILGRVEGLLDREPGASPRQATRDLGDAPREVIEKIERLSQTPDIHAAYLLRNAEIVVGTTTAALDEVVVSRALSRLALVFQDMEDQQNVGSTEIQATVGEHRLVVDRLGPVSLGFQIGVVVRQATPICKSLRRLLRQIDRSFRKTLAKQAQQASAAGESPGGRPAPTAGPGFQRVAI